MKNKTEKKSKHSTNNEKKTERRASRAVQLIPNLLFANDPKAKNKLLINNVNPIAFKKRLWQHVSKVVRKREKKKQTKSVENLLRTFTFWLILFVD